jgi:hypothetical protein
MKTWIICAVCALATTGSFASGKNKSHQAANRAAQSLATAYENVEHAVWSSAANNMTKATFVLDGKPATAFFNSDGDLIATSIVAGYATVPKSVQKKWDKIQAETPVLEAFEMRSEEEHAYYLRTDNGGKDLVYRVTPEGFATVYAGKKK